MNTFSGSPLWMKRGCGAASAGAAAAAAAAVALRGATLRRSAAARRALGRRGRFGAAAAALIDEGLRRGSMDSRPREYMGMTVSDVIPGVLHTGQSWGWWGR